MPAITFGTRPDSRARIIWGDGRWAPPGMERAEGVTGYRSCSVGRIRISLMATVRGRVTM